MPDDTFAGELKTVRKDETIWKLLKVIHGTQSLRWQRWLKESCAKIDGFFFLMTLLKHNSNTPSQREAYPNLASLTTSCTEGMSHPVRRRSNRDTANDLAKQHANRVSDSVLQNLWVFFRLRLGKALRKSAVSQDQRLRQPRRPDGPSPPHQRVQGVVSFALRAACKATPIEVAAFRRAEPSQK